MKISMNNLNKTALAAICAFSVSGCSWFLAEVDDKEVIDLHKDMKAVKRETPFSESLRKLGIMLNAYYTPKTPVQSKNVGNRTAEKGVPSDIYVMVASAINKIGPQVTFVPYDVQYVISETTTGGQIMRLYPKIVISGGITGFDKDMIEKSRDVEAQGGWAGAQGGGKMSAEAHHSRITLDLNALDYRTQSYFPGVIASNSIILNRDRFGWGVYGYYMGCGGSFDYEIKHKQGVHAALRTLVEYSIIEVLGKYFEVPYWHCIQGANKDEGMISIMKEKFASKSKDEQNMLLKKLLFLHGYRGIEMGKSSFNAAEDGALAKSMRLVRTSNPVDAYIGLWETVPIAEAVRRVRIDRRKKALELKRKAEKKAELAKKQEEEAKARAKEEKRIHETKVAQYKEHVTSGDRLFKQKKYSQALKEYQNANKLFGGEESPAKMIKKIEIILAKQRAGEKALQETLKEADALYSKAESESFKFINYKKALNAYQKALLLAPDDKKILTRMKELKKKMNKYSTVLQTEGGQEW